MMTHAKRDAVRAIAALAVLGGMAVNAPSAWAGQGHHPGSGYGVQGGVTENLALANVYSGLYGLDYTYARVPPYRRPTCRDVDDRLPNLQDLIIRPCS